MTGREKVEQYADTQRALNKVYCAVHDRVCPKCGSDMSHHHYNAHDLVNTHVNVHFCTNQSCRFHVTSDEMDAMRQAVAEWGKTVVEVFEHWQAMGVPQIAQMEEAK